MTPLAALLAGVAFAQGTPVAVARAVRGHAIEEAVSGRWPDGTAVTPTDKFYAASLTKQVTGAAVAVLVREGRLDPDRPVGRFIDLPAWADRVTVRHLLHHTGGLPEATPEEEAPGSGDWTEARVLASVRDEGLPVGQPGLTFAYSNVGFILLAQVVGGVSGMPFAAFVTERIFHPLGLDGMAFPGDLSALRQAPFLGSVRPLTHGDGGLWCTARGFAHWLDTQNEDRLGIAPLVTAPGRLNDGSPIDYGWGIAPRYHRDGPILIHGGGWARTGAFVMRSPRHGVSVAVFAAGATPELIDKLATSALEGATL